MLTVFFNLRLSAKKFLTDRDVGFRMGGGGLLLSLINQAANSTHLPNILMTRPWALRPLFAS